jgi:hypothetical protein
MSAVDPLRAARDRRKRLRAVERPAEKEAGTEAGVRGRTNLKCAYRPPDANFYCWKYGVWYNVLDCCYRHDHRTYSGCAGCGQGAGNLRANLERYRAARHLGDPARSAR